MTKRKGNGIIVFIYFGAAGCFIANGRQALRRIQGGAARNFCFHNGSKNSAWDMHMGKQAFPYAYPRLGPAKPGFAPPRLECV